MTDGAQAQARAGETPTHQITSVTTLDQEALKSALLGTTLDYQNRKLRPAKWGPRSSCDAEFLSRPWQQWVKSSDPDPPRARAYVCTTPESYLIQRIRHPAHHVVLT